MEEENSKIISKFNIIATCAQILLALATIYFTYNISEKQNRISKLEYSPLFVLEKDQLYTKTLYRQELMKLKSQTKGMRLTITHRTLIAY